MKEATSVDNMRKSDSYTIENKTPSKKLMYTAGEGIFNAVDWHGRTLVVCGSGNNAGDGYVVACLLKDRGYDVELLLLSDKFSCDGKYYFDMCCEKSISWSLYDGQSFCGYDIILDCIFGTGFKGAVTGKAKEVIEKINNSGAYVVSADINSGLNGDSGLGETVVKSNLTVSVGTAKAGHYLNMAKDKIGSLVNVDIGIDLIEKPYYVIEKEDVKKFLGRREHFSHKGTYGYITLIGGCLEYSGAIKLAGISSAAMRSGCGVVKIATPRSLCPGVMPYILESTLYPLSERDGAIAFVEGELAGALNNVRAVAVGMGMGQKGDNEKILEYVLKNYSIPVIIDADGLNTLSRMDISIVKNSKCKVVLTPHLKELERLSGTPVEQIQKRAVECAMDYAKRSGATVLLKGPATIVTDGVDVYISTTGSPGMATAGSGDVLSGIICALCAGYEDTLCAVAVGAYINGYAGELAQEELGEISMLASDTAKSVGKAIKQLTQN